MRADRVGAGQGEDPAHLPLASHPQPRGYLHDRFLHCIAKIVQLLRGDGQRRGHWQDVAANSDPDAAAFQRLGKSPSDADFGRERRGFCCCGAMFAGSVGSN